MKLVMILVAFLLVPPMFSSGIVETSYLNNVNDEVKEEMVMNRRRVDLEMDYTGPHPRPPTPPKEQKRVQLRNSYKP
ncbi:PREDICTED: uncharacterized protein LOC104770821 [Camelina sativa]|uniref:Uncharacterized protein LOC104770821 n=1 Tax=Camelina sativa TaxID=90675 RepID=A0ABM0Y0D4_CAMSA|nr:PREDICTED: uncharacterized protein LOC104770821 [Camelina sativa]